VILAAAHAGLCPMRCSVCLQDETAKEAWGCEQPSPTPVWELDGDLWYSCPMLWITRDIIEWYQQYAYGEKFGTRPWSDMPWLWTWAAGEYGRALSDFQGRKAAEQAKKLDSLRSLRVGRQQEEQTDG